MQCQVQGRALEQAQNIQGWVRQRAKHGKTQAVVGVGLGTGLGTCGVTPRMHMARLRARLKAGLGQGGKAEVRLRVVRLRAVRLREVSLRVG